MRAPEYTSNLPSELRAGDLWTWSDEIRSDLDSSYTLSYRFIGPSRLSVQGTLSGTTHSFTVATTETTKVTPGIYQVFRSWSKSGVLISDVQLRIQILPEASKLEQASDVRDWIDLTLENLRSAIVTLSRNPLTTVTINGRSYTKSELPVLIATYNRMRLEEQKRDAEEKIKRGLDPGGRVLLRFRELT